MSDKVGQHKSVMPVQSRVGLPAWTAPAIGPQGSDPKLRSRWTLALGVAFVGIFLVFVLAAAATSRIRGLQERLTHIEQRLERLEVP